MPKKKTQKEMLHELRQGFRYYADGTADIFSYGSFKRGVTSNEIDDYLRVRANKINIKVIRRKFNKIAGCNTAACAEVEGKMITLNYRHDVERFADVLFKGIPTYFD